MTDAAHPSHVWRLGILAASLTVAVAILTLLFRVNSPGLADEVVEELSTTGEFEVYSLDPILSETMPSDEWQGEKLGGWLVLGSTPVEPGEVRRAILTELSRAIQGNDGLETAACFWPRHAIRWHDGLDSMEIVICFECHQLTIKSPGGSSHENMHTDTAQPLLDDVLRKAGVKLAPKPGEESAQSEKSAD